jgi:hypothetical protein
MRRGAANACGLHFGGGVDEPGARGYKGPFS